METYNIPGVFGCIDGSHIVIDPPNTNKDDYINRKGTTSIQLQAVCNSDKKFISFFTGFPGSVHDSRVFANSPVKNNLENLPPGLYLLGDSGYPCRTYLITPYKNNGRMTPVQKHFNKKMSDARVKIEHTFGIFKQRFRQLYYCKLRGIVYLCHFFRACAVLHNLSKEEEIDMFRNEVPIIEENAEQEVEYVYAEEPLANGKLQRDLIAAHMYPN